MIDDGHGPSDVKSLHKSCKRVRQRGLNDESGAGGFFKWAWGTLCRNALESSGLLVFQQSVEAFADSTVAGQGEMRAAGIIFDSGLQVFLMVKPGGRVTKLSKSESAIWRGFSNYKNGIRMSGTGKNRRYYRWDHTHGDIEVYNHNKEHIGSMDPSKGTFYKGPEKGRKL